MPNDTNFSISESVLEQNKLEAFGENFDVSKSADVLITYTARYPTDGTLLYAEGDAVDSSTEIVVYRKVADLNMNIVTYRDRPV